MVSIKKFKQLSVLLSSVIFNLTRYTFFKSSFHLGCSSISRLTGLIQSCYCSRSTRRRSTKFPLYSSLLRGDGWGVADVVVVAVVPAASALPERPSRRSIRCRGRLGARGRCFHSAAHPLSKQNPTDHGDNEKNQRDPRNNNHSKLLRPLGVRVAVDLKRQLARDVVVAVDVVVKTNVFRKDEKLWSVFSCPESGSMQKQKKTFAKFSNFCHFVTKDDVSNADVDVKNAGFLCRLSSAKTIFLWINQTWAQL